MNYENAKSFINHKHNGFFLKFPNGNALSTIFGAGSYSENHNLLNNYSTLLKDGSNNVEVMIFTKDESLSKLIYEHFETDDSVIGYLTMTQWLWIVNKLTEVPAAIPETKEK